MQAACKIAVEDGGFALAWIGFVEPETQRIRVSARYGRDEGYLDAVKISLRDDVPEGRGPTGVAMREGRPFINNDTANNPVMGPWRSEQVKRGFLSSASFPLRSRGSTIGVITLYADTANYFDEEEVRLLTTLADDFSFALEAAQVARKRAAAEEALRDRTTSSKRGSSAGPPSWPSSSHAPGCSWRSPRSRPVRWNRASLASASSRSRAASWARRTAASTWSITAQRRPVPSPTFGFPAGSLVVSQDLPIDNGSLAGRAIITGKVQVARRRDGAGEQPPSRGRRGTETQPAGRLPRKGTWQDLRSRHAGLRRRERLR